MEKIEMLYPEKFQILGGKVVISESTFMDFIKVLNRQAKKLNALAEENESLKQDVAKLTTNVQNIAKALSLYMED